MRRIAVVLVDRANYGRLKPVMSAIAEHPELSLQVICAGTMVLDRFDRPVRVVASDGFAVDSEIYIELEGSTPATMAKSLGFAVIEFASEFQRLKPDVVLVIGDRYEALAATLAASYMNLCVAHVQGGEVSGSIDESARHCITKLAHFHYPATPRAADFLIRMGERTSTVQMVGCPSGDIARTINRQLPPQIFEDGVGAPISPDKPYVLVVFHPVTTSFDEDMSEVDHVLKACGELDMQVVWLWPNIDAGADKVSGAIRRFREAHHPNWLRLVKNFRPEDYLLVLANATCAVGNSSSFVRDSSFFGTPVVLIGDRQTGREIAENVTLVAEADAGLAAVIQAQVRHGRYAPSTLYGDGHASARIADHLASLTPFVQKTLAYVG